MRRKNNSIWKLHDHLEVLRKQSSGVAVRIAFGEAFGLNSNDLPTLYKTNLLLRQMVDDAERKVQQTENINHELYLRSFPTIKRALSIPNWDSAWAGSQQHLTETAVADMAFCAEMLSLYHHEIEVKPEDLAEIQQQIDALFQRVSESKINRRLRQTILELLEVIRSAIAQYKIVGISGLHDSVAISLGKLALQHEELAASKEEKELKEFWQLLVKIEGVVSKVMEYKPLLEASIPFLIPAVTH